MTTRRDLLKAAAGLPALPLLPLASLAGCAVPPASAVSPAAAVPAAALTGLRFTGMPAPTLAEPAAMASTTVGSRLQARFADGSVREWPLGYERLFATGQRVPDGRGGQVVAGGCYDIRQQPIMDRSVPGRERQFFSDCPDGMSLLTLPGVRAPGVQGNTVFAVVQFEYTSRDQAGRSAYGILPSPMAVLTLDQDPATGRLALVRYHPVDTAGVHGLWTTCGASLSPWNTHLSSEEYEPDAARADDPLLRGFSASLYGDRARANPYRYGHLPEVTVNADGTGSIRKHYATGRISKELVQVMPDERTLMMGDDFSNAGAFMFVADRPRDLSSGTLYVARWNATSNAGPGAATLTWIRLGHASSCEIEALVEGGIRAADIMDIRRTDPGDASFTRIPYAGGFNWVRLKPGMETAAAFLETHRYAALVGGSLGFTKWEGTTLDARDRVAYVAISRIEAPMRNGSGGIAVQGPFSGAVYRLNLRPGQRDAAGAAIASDWVPVDMAAVPALVARDLGGDAQRPNPGRRVQDALGNFADPDRIACPDNLKFSQRLRTLFIGEDSSTHVNNFLWAYQVDTGELVRLLSCPVGAESTGLHAVDDIHGWTYVATNFQHPGDWESPLHDKVRPVLEPLVREMHLGGYAGGVGYLTLGPARAAPAAA
ncbi:PhoX family protein [Ramlibacter sp. MAHUQ-53]|uniref:PhoX family protein n=1 Tax=unclassified Ramlibacter TaxID=2617605 RepID=UPI00363405DC